MVLPLTVFIGFGLGIAMLWAYALHDLRKSTLFTRPEQIVWFVIVLLGPVVGSIAYLSAKRYVQRFSQPDPTRLPRLLAKSGKR